MAAALLAITYSWLQPHFEGDAEKLVGVVWYSRISSGGDGLRIVMEPYRWFILLFLLLCNGCYLLDPFGDFPSATNNIRLALGGAATAARRRHGLRLKMKGI